VTYRTAAAAGISLLFVSIGAWAALEHTPVHLEKLDSSLDQLISPTAQLKKVATGFKWTEGPLWAHNVLLFAEIPSNSIRMLSPEATLAMSTGGNKVMRATKPAEVSIFMQPSGFLGSGEYGGPESGSNGMTLDKDGRVTAAGHAQRDIWRLESFNGKAKQTILADAYQGKKLNSPNDLVYKSDGSLYFTDPPYGLRSQSDQDPDKELKVNGVFRIPAASSIPAGAKPDNSKLQLIIDDLPRPNGIAFSPDEKTLYIADSGPKKIWMRYDVKPDGTVANGQVFFDATSDKRVGGPDGIKVDTLGNLYGSGPGGIWIFSPNGKHLGTILTPERAANLAWGGEDGKTMYITASTSIYRVQMNVAGKRP
jgi:gluconolactonase